MERRTDEHTAALINKIVSDLLVKGISHSAQALYDVGASLEIAKRVLTRPSDRRPARSNIAQGHRISDY